MTERAREVLADALALSDDERRDLGEQLVSSLPADPEWLAELERRARRALIDPADGEAWEVVEQRLESRMRGVEGAHAASRNLTGGRAR